MKKRVFTVVLMVFVFLFQVQRGLGPNVQPYVVVVSGLMTAFLAWAALQIVFALYSKFKK